MKLIFLFVVRVMKADFLLVCWPKILFFRMSVQNDLVFVWVVLFDFSARDRIRLHFIAEIKLIWLLCEWSKLT